MTTCLILAALPGTFVATMIIVGIYWSMAKPVELETKQTLSHYLVYFMF